MKAMIFDSIGGEPIKRREFQLWADCHDWIMEELSGWMESGDVIEWTKQPNGLRIAEIVDPQSGEVAVDFKGAIRL